MKIRNSKNIMEELFENLTEMMRIVSTHHFVINSPMIPGTNIKYVCSECGALGYRRWIYEERCWTDECFPLVCNIECKDKIIKDIKDWQNFDIASYNLAISLGIMKSSNLGTLPYKYVFWSNHPVGEMLAKILISLTKLDILEYNEDHLSYRWNPNYRGDWDLTEDEKVVKNIIE